MERDDILSFIEAGTMAPSGDNVQPWRARLRPNGFSLLNDPSCDTSVYDWNHRAGYASHGAFLENVSIAAGARGYEAIISLFPEGQTSDYVATVEFVPCPIKADPLAAAISKRGSNRKAYTKQPLESSEREMLLTRAHTSEAEVSFYDDPKTVTALGEAVARNEEILFSNKAMHSFFFDHIRWNKKEADAVRTGFPLGTLELPPPAQLLFPFWKHWSIMSVFAAIGFPRVIAKENAKVYASAAGFGAIFIPDTEAVSYVRAGRALERLWLSATSLGLAMQTFIGVPILYERIDAGMGDPFTKHQQEVIITAHRGLRDAIGLKDGKKIGILCRIGKGPVPSARTLRRPVNEIILS